MADVTEYMVAQSTTQPGGPNPPPGQQNPPNFLLNPLTGLMLAVVVFYFVLFRGQGKKRKQTAKMLQNIKKNDRVLTIGGIVGRVMSTKEDEIVVKVDESSNIKMTFVRKAIQKIITDDDNEK